MAIRNSQENKGDVFRRHNELWERLFSCVTKLRDMFTLSKIRLVKWYFDVIFFLTIATISVVNIFLMKSEIVAIVTCVLNLYYLYRFSIVGWFSTEHYYSHINVFNKHINLPNGSVRMLKRSIYGASSQFVILVIILSFANSLSFTAEVIYFFEEKERVISEIAIMIVHLLLVPSFVRLFETMVDRRRQLYGSLNNAFVKQSEAMDNLFDNYNFGVNYVNASFPEYNLKTRHNIFFVDNKKYDAATKKVIKEANEELIEVYRSLWSDYMEIIEIIRELAISHGRFPWRRLRGLTMEYLRIWDNFFLLN